MPIITISKIKMRSGRKHDGSGIPQLSNAEFGWAIDARELYIGNGPTSKGAPFVGNTRILTEHDIDSILDGSIATAAPMAFNEEVNGYDYSYKAASDIETGHIDGLPYVRNVDDVLDDDLFITSFGVNGDGVSDNTENIQSALNELLVKHASIDNRVIVNFPPGEFIISDVIQLPPYVTIRGAGIDKTIIKQVTASSPVFKTIGNDNISTSNIELNGMTLNGSYNATVMQLDNCVDSVFSSLKLIGYPFDAINEKSLVNMVNGHNDKSMSGNMFEKCVFEDATIGVQSNSYITLNVFDKCTFKNLEYGILFGDLLEVNNSFSPSYNTISNNTFLNIRKQAINIGVGKYNKSMFNTFINVGNSSETNESLYPIIKFKERNFSMDDIFQRTETLIINDNNIQNVPYVTEVESRNCNRLVYSDTVILPFLNNKVGFIRLPFDNSKYKIEYSIIGIGYNGYVAGTLYVLPDNLTCVKLIDNTVVCEVDDKNYMLDAVPVLDKRLNIVYINLSNVREDIKHEVTFNIFRI